MASFDQKLRTLYLMEILLERTDDEHMLNASELCTILDQEYGIRQRRKSHLSYQNRQEVIPILFPI